MIHWFERTPDFRPSLKRHRRVLVIIKWSIQVMQHQRLFRRSVQIWMRFFSSHFAVVLFCSTDNAVIIFSPVFFPAFKDFNSFNSQHLIIQIFIFSVTTAELRTKVCSYTRNVGLDLPGEFKGLNLLLNFTVVLLVLKKCCCNIKNKLQHGGVCSTPPTPTPQKNLCNYFKSSNKQLISMPLYSGEVFMCLGNHNSSIIKENI